MTHLLVHLVKEIDILGPVFLHNMFPFERFMGVQKKCVRNRARPEGSIASAYGTEGIIDFCVDFIDDLKPIGVPALLEKCPWVPVESALWYQFLEPVPRKRYQRLEPLVPGKTTGTYG